MSILAQKLPPAAVAVLVLKVEKAREYAAIHAAACRYRRQGLVCSTCVETRERAARLAKLAVEVRP